MASHKTATLISKQRLTPDSWIFTFSVGEALGFLGGQYVILNSGLKDENGADLKRAYSIFSLDTADQRQFQIAVKTLEAGRVSAHLAKLEQGAQLQFSGPWGKFLKDPAWPKSGRTLVLATDTGISSALSLIASAKFAPLRENIWLLWLRGFSEDLLPQDRLNAWLEHCGLLGTERVWLREIAAPREPHRVSEALKITETLLERAGDFTNAWLAGDGKILREVEELLRARGVPGENVGVEAFFNKASQDSAKALPPGPPPNRAALREGFTTGACSAAAAKAATRLLLTRAPLTSIETTLPNRTKVTFALKRSELHLDFALCSIVKDAGDDPDATHGAELTAEVRFLGPAQEIALKGGPGVATVTKPGLGLEVGGPAINPVPRKNITEMVLEELRAQGCDKGVEVTISVPGGEEMAKKTLNARLGLLGGISILGTTGIVKPYSTAAYRASVVQGIAVARSQGADTVVLTTGGKSEKYAMDLFPKLDVVSFIQVGDFIGAAVKAAVKSQLKRAVVVGMMGKLSKMADGRMMTHAAGSEVNIPMLAEIARSIGVPASVCDEIEKANTARHVLELCQRAGFPQISRAICQKVVSVLAKYAGQGLNISCYLVDFNGTLLGAEEGLAT